MIIKKGTKHPIVRTDLPNTNWADDTYFVIDDNSELGQKILSNAPYYNEVLNVSGNIIDIAPIAKPPEPLKQPSTEDRVEALEMAMLTIMG